jgi:pyridoxine 5-phosphate synthase
MGTDGNLIEKAAELGTTRIELYTGPYAENPEQTIRDYVKAAEVAIKSGLELNAGHDLSLENLQLFKKSIPTLAEVSIGHALISDALYFGIENAIQMYKRCLQD